MPNHCENDLWVYGPIAKQTEFVTFMQSNLNHGIFTEEVSEFNFEVILPYPKKYIDIDFAAREEEKKLKALTQAERNAWLKNHEWPKDGYNSGGYEWCIHAWGTKWNAYEIKRAIRNKSTFYTFQTAWSPPVPVITALAARFPELRFVLKWYERGAAVKGILKFEKGELIYQDSQPYRGNRGG